MASTQTATTWRAALSSVPLEVADAATRYQAHREIEAQHLALMARHNLLDDWTPDVRRTVLAARDKVQQAREARARFRGQVRGLVVAMREHGEPLPSVLRLTRAMLELLEQDGALRNDGGWLEVEVLEWAIEDYEAVS